jgi:hypothetical protein
MDNYTLSNGIYTLCTLLGIGIGYYYFRYPSKKVESFNPESDEIIVLDITNIDTQEIIPDSFSELYSNVQKYLDHHLSYESSNTFVPIDFDSGPINVRFKHINEIYQISLKRLKSTNKDHGPINSTPLYLSGTVKYKGKDTCVTQKLREFHGNNRNFFSHIPDTIHHISYYIEHMISQSPKRTKKDIKGTPKHLQVIFDDYKGGDLHTFDMNGQTKIHTI